jgi:hypothetical protein
MVKLWRTDSGVEIRSLSGHTYAVYAVTFDPYGSQLATCGHDGTVRIWEAATGKELLVIQGNNQPIYSLVYSPDGSRLATAGHDGWVRLYETNLGTELLSFRGSPFLDVTFSSDGQRLAASCRDGSVHVWETSTPSWHLVQHRAAVDLAESLLISLGNAEQVVGQLQRDSSIPEELRKEAIEVAQHHPLWLNNTSWYMVRYANGNRSDYARGLEMAQEACRKEPENGYYLNTLGVAQFRMGLYTEALASLTRSDQLNSSDFGFSIPADLAFLAMTHYHLGQKPQAEADLVRLRKAMEVRWRPDEAQESQAFLKELESLLKQSRVRGQQG